MAHIHWWREMSAAIKGDKLHQLNRWNQTPIIVIPSVNKVPQGGQNESLWNHIYGGRGLELNAEPSVLVGTPQWEAADAEMKVLSGESTELKRSPIKAWSRSVSSHTCYAYYQEFSPRFFLPFQSIHLHFFQNLSRFFLCWLCLTHGSSVGPQNKIGHPAGGRFPCWVSAEHK